MSCANCGTCFSENSYDYVLGDTAKDFTVEYQQEFDDGRVEPADLSAYTGVQMRLRDERGCINIISGVFDDASNGLFSFQINTVALGDGCHRGQIELTDGSGDLEIHPTDSDDEIIIRISKGV